MEWSLPTSCGVGQSCINGNCQDNPIQCGNNILETGEECDDGNTNDGDGCSSTCQIEITQDTTPPSITIIQPNNGDIFYYNKISAYGTSFDNVEVSKVQLKLNNDDWRDATGTASWSKDIILKKGLNNINVKAIDANSLETAKIININYNFPQVNDFIATPFQDSVKLTWNYNIPGNDLSGSAVRNIITGNAVLDNLKKAFSGIADFFKKIFGLGGVGVRLEGQIESEHLYNFEIFRDDQIQIGSYGIITSYGADSNYCSTIDNQDYNCEYQDNNLNSGIYYYKIRMYNDEGESEYLGPVKAEIKEEQDTQDPLIISVSPNDNENDVLVDANIVVEFSEEMDKLSAESSFSLKDSENQEIVNGDFSWDQTNKILRFNPENDLFPNSEHQIIITVGAKDLAGNNLINQYESIFRTKSVESCQDECFAQGNNQCASDYEYQICGNYDQDECLEWGGKIDLQCDQGEICVINQNNQAECNIPDTKAPEINYVDPADKSNNVPIDTKITIEFSEAMNKESVESAVSLTDIDDSSNINGIISWDESDQRILTFIPDNDLKYDHQHIFTISTSAKDLNENKLTAEFSSEFITSSAPDTTPPTIISISPSDNSNSLPVNGEIMIVFSKPMNRGSVEDAFSLTSITGQEPIISNSIWESDTEFLVTPLYELDYNTLYEIKIDVAAKDINGNNLEGIFLSSFTTVLCSSGDLKQGTECLVCNQAGLDYEQDNNQCNTGQICQIDGNCKDVIIEIYPKAELAKINSEKRFDVYGEGTDYIWSKEGESCTIASYSSYGIASFSGLGYCNITATDIRGAFDKSYIRIIEDNPIVESKEISLNSQDNAEIITNDNTNLGLFLTAPSTGNIKVDVYNSNLVQDPSSLISANKFFLIEADKEIADNLNKFIINISYDKNNLGDINENSMKIYYYNIQNNEWIDEENSIISSYGSNYYVSSEFNHFSLFGLFGESVSQPPSDSGGSSGGGGGGSGGGGGRGKCLEDWKCDPWSQCINGKQTRECKDAKFCNNYYSNVPKPSELSSCTSALKEKEKEQKAQKEEIGGEIESQKLIEEKKKSKNLLIYIIIITFLIVAIASLIFRKRIFKHNEKPEIDSKPKNDSDKIVDLVKDIRNQGYGDYQIKEELYKKGWNKNQIDEIFKRL